MQRPAPMLELLRLPRNDAAAAVAWRRRARAEGVAHAALRQATEALLMLQDDPAELLALLAAEPPLDRGEAPANP